VDPVFQANNPNSTYSVDHSSWNQFLSRNLASDGQGVNRVYYGRVSGQDRQLLGGYLQQLQGTDIRALNRDEQFAYWVNLYNARTVALVLDNYPVQSIHDRFTTTIQEFTTHLTVRHTDVRTSRRPPTPVKT